MSSGIVLELGRIERSLTALGRWSRLALRPGVSQGRVQRILVQLGFGGNADLEALYGWHNGADTEQAFVLDDLHLFPGFYLLSLEDASANYASFVNDPRWDRNWLPLFANGGGDFYVLDLIGDPVGTVRHFRIDERIHPVEFMSLTGMLETLAECFESGVFYVHKRGYLEMDDSQFAAVAARVNPDVAWWHTEQ